jgi:heme-degrading monooxygenase HmoA
MYARKSTTKGSPAQVDKAKQVMETQAIPRVKEIPGFKGGYWLIDRETGEGITFTFFETEDHLKKSAETANQIRSSAVREIDAEVISVDEFEVALDTGQKIHNKASHARVVDFDGDPNAIKMIEQAVLPQAKQLPGFLGGFWLFDRAANKGVGVTLFDSAETLAASRDAANRIRSEGAGRTAGRIGEFKEYEVLARAETTTGAAAR